MHLLLVSGKRRKRRKKKIEKQRKEKDGNKRRNGCLEKWFMTITLILIYWMSSRHLYRWWGARMKFLLSGILLLWREKDSKQLKHDHWAMIIPMKKYDAGQGVLFYIRWSGKTSLVRRLLSRDLSKARKKSMWTSGRVGIPGKREKWVQKPWHSNLFVKTEEQRGWSEQGWGRWGAVGSQRSHWLNTVSG